VRQYALAPVGHQPIQVEIRFSGKPNELHTIRPEIALWRQFDGIRLPSASTNEKDRPASNSFLGGWGWVGWLGGRLNPLRNLEIGTLQRWWRTPVLLFGEKVIVHQQGRKAESFLPQPLVIGGGRQTRVTQHTLDFRFFLR